MGARDWSLGVWGDEEDDFAFDGFGGVVSEEIWGEADAIFFELFAEFAGDADFLLGEELGADGEGFEEAVRGFEEDAGDLAVGGGAEVAFSAAAFDGEEATVEELFGGEAAPDQGGEDGAGAWENRVGEAAFDAGAEEAVAWVADSGHPGIGDEGDLFAIGEVFEEFGGASGFVVFVVTDEGFGDFEVAEEIARMTGIFAGDEIGILQRLDGSKGDVSEVTDRSGDEGEHAGERDREESEGLPAFGEVTGDFDGEIFGGEGEGLAFVLIDIGGDGAGTADEESGLAGDILAVDEFARGAIGDRVGAAEGEEEFAREEDIAADRADGGADDFFEATLDDGIAFVIAGDFESAILLDLFDEGIGEEDFDARGEGIVAEVGDGEGIDIGHAGRFDGTDVVTCAATEEEAEEREKGEESHFGGLGRVGSGVAGRVSGAGRGGSTAGPRFRGEVRSFGLSGPATIFSSGTTTGGPT